MITALLHDPTTGETKKGGRELLEAWTTSTTSLMWLVIEAEEPETETALLKEHFGVHPMAVADALRDRHPPKIESFENNTFILLKGLDAASTSLEFGTIQLSLFLGERFLVSRSAAHSASTAKLLAEVESGSIAADLPRGVLALTLCRTVFDRFLPILLGVERRLERLEAEMLSSPNDELLGELVRQKGDLRVLLRILQYHSQIFSQVKNQASGLLGNYQHELIDVQDQLDRHLSLARLYYDLTDDLVNGYLSISAHRLNQIMQTLTIVTVIFVPITFMAGIYGMNFEYIPELGFRHGYFFLLGAMLIVISGILWIFRAKGWLGRSRKESPG